MSVGELVGPFTTVDDDFVLHDILTHEPWIVMVPRALWFNRGAVRAGQGVSMVAKTWCRMFAVSESYCIRESAT